MLLFWQCNSHAQLPEFLLFFSWKTSVSKTMFSMLIAWMMVKGFPSRGGWKECRLFKSPSETICFFDIFPMHGLFFNQMGSQFIKCWRVGFCLLTLRMAMWSFHDSEWEGVFSAERNAGSYRSFKHLFQLFFWKVVLS